MFISAWFALILIVTVIPVSGPRTDMPADKILHFVIYGLTAIFLFRYFAGKMNYTNAVSASVIIAAAYGTVMEILQYVIPYRSFSIGDIAANGTGAFVGCLLYAFINKKL